jgi:hypothetical protein
MAVVPYDAADARAQLINQEARVQSIRLEETYVQYSEYLQYTEYDVRMQIDGRVARLQQLEEVAERSRHSAGESETRLLIDDMQQAMKYTQNAMRCSTQRLNIVGHDITHNKSSLSPDSRKLCKAISECEMNMR